MSYPARSLPAISWSYSSLQQILNGCSLQFYFQRIAAIESEVASAVASLGTAAHHAHALARSRKMAGESYEIADLLEVFDASWDAACLDGGLRFRKGQDQESLREQGHKLVELMAENLGEFEVLGVEQEFRLQIELPKGERCFLGGFFDAVLRDTDGSIIIVDLKTSATSWGESRVADSLQATVYAWAARQLYGDDARLQFEVLVKNKSPKFQRLEAIRDEDDYRRLTSLIQTAENMIDAGVFYPCESWLCGSCGYRDECRAWGSRS